MTLPASSLLANRFVVFVLTMTTCCSVSSAATPDSPPLSPDESLRQIHLHAGYEIELVASEPLVKDPVAIDWDRHGRLWVVEMADYPYGMDGQGKPGGRVRILEDTDADGRYDRSTLFLDEISFPTGLMTWRDGVLVTAAPELFYAEDRDGDGVADVRQTLFRGFMEGNQQLRVNGLRWGLDNWVYCAGGGHHAGFGANTSIRCDLTGEAVPLGSRDFRFQPDAGRLDPQSGPSQFGRVRDDQGNWFGVQNSYPLWHFVLADHYLRRNKWGEWPDSRRQLILPANPPVYSAKPPEKRFHGPEMAGHFTSACGPAIYRDELLFPRETGVTHAFTCEPFHNLVQHLELRDDGVSFQGRRAPTTESYDFFASTDQWCRPVMVRTGPDGCLWVVDMYRYMIEHPDWLPEEGRAELLPFYRSGDDLGRIYRIRSSERPPHPPLDFAEHHSSDWVERLNSSNGIVRDLAQRTLVASQTRQAVERLNTMMRSSDNPTTRLYALATLEGLDEISAATLLEGLQDESPAVRRHAVWISERFADRHTNVQQRLVEMARDPDARVRLQLAFTLGMIAQPAVAPALLELAATSADDEYLRAAVVSSIPAHRESLVRLTLAQDDLDDAWMRALVLSCAEHRSLLAQLATAATPSSADGLSASALRRCTLWLDAVTSQGTSLDHLASASDDELSDWLRRLPVVMTEAWQLALDQSTAEPTRVTALRLLRHDQAASTHQRRDAAALLSPQMSADIQLAVVRLLATRGDRDTMALLLEAWRSYSPTVRDAVCDTLLSRDIGTAELLNSIEAGQVRPLDLDAVRRQRLVEHRDKSIAARAQRLLQQPSANDRAIVMQQYRPALELAGHAEDGAKVFRRLCATCHAPPEGAALGPNLASVTDRSNEALFRSILDPSAAVEPKYLGYHAELATGEVVFGLIANESGNSLELRQQDGQSRRLVRDAIQNLQSSGLSFMPVGLEAEMSPRDLADVMEYVRSLGKEAGSTGQ